MSTNLPAVRRRRFIQNLKAGDRVKWIGLAPDIPYGTISDVNGGLVLVVVDMPNGDRWDQEIYREEITERVSEFNPIPITALRLKYLIELAEPETEERRRRRIEAQEELMFLLDQQQIMRTTKGDWIIDPAWGLEKFL